FSPLARDSPVSERWLQPTGRSNVLDSPVGTDGHNGQAKLPPHKERPGIDYPGLVRKRRGLTILGNVRKQRGLRGARDCGPRVPARRRSKDREFAATSCTALESYRSHPFNWAECRQTL